jgi:hypothetical protein
LKGATILARGKNGKNCCHTPTKRNGDRSETFIIEDDHSGNSMEGEIHYLGNRPISCDQPEAAKIQVRLFPADDKIHSDMIIPINTARVIGVNRLVFTIKTAIGARVDNCQDHSYAQQRSEKDDQPCRANAYCRRGKLLSAAQ